MPTTRSTVVFVHDTGYMDADGLLMHINSAIAGKDMRAVSAVFGCEVGKESPADDFRSDIQALADAALKAVRIPQSEMTLAQQYQDRLYDLFDLIESLCRKHSIAPKDEPLQPTTRGK